MLLALGKTQPFPTFVSSRFTPSQYATCFFPCIKLAGVQFESEVGIIRESAFAIDFLNIDVPASLSVDKKLARGDDFARAPDSI